MRKTKIICTMGPAVESEEKIRELIEAGMDAARFNFSHGSHEEHKRRIEMVRKVASEMNATVAFILDTKGPEIRVTSKIRKSKCRKVRNSSYTMMFLFCGTRMEWVSLIHIWGKT